MSVFSRLKPKPWPDHGEATRIEANPSGGLPRDHIAAAFELLLGRGPANEAEIAAAGRFGDLRELVDQLIRTDAFRTRYEEMCWRGEPAASLAIGRPPPPRRGDAADEPARRENRVARAWRALVGRPAADAGRAAPPAAVWSDLIDQLAAIDHRLSRLVRLSHGGKSVYVGGGRVMTKISLRQWNIAYLLEADDLLLAPPLLINGYHEIDLTEYFINNLRDGYNCLDVGANFGYFTCIMGRWSPRGRTIAVEPDPKVFALLRDNIFINNLEAATFARNVAAADVAGTLTLHHRVTRSGNTSIAPPSDAALAAIGEPPAQPFEIGAIAIDSLLPEFGGRIDCMKIDVEGAEPLVFRGAQRAIRENPQLKIVMEWSPGQLQDAGFDPRGFTAELAAQGLRPAAIGAAGIGQPITWEALLSLPYHPGILLTQAQ